MMHAHAVDRPKVATAVGQKAATEVATRTTSLIEIAGATGLEPATFGVTGRTKFNGINDSCKFFRG
jgi:hypothetical protein